MGGMVRRSAVALGSWLLATAVATAATLVGVSLVTTGFVSSPPLTVPERPGEPAAPARPVPFDTATAPSGRATFASTGGVVAASCEAQQVRLESATPHPGHRVVVGSAGPRRIEVAFPGATAVEDIRVACDGGEPVRIGSDGRPSGAGDQAASSDPGRRAARDPRASAPGPPTTSDDRMRPDDPADGGRDPATPDGGSLEGPGSDRLDDPYGGSGGDAGPPADADDPTADTDECDGWEGTDDGSRDSGSYGDDPQSGAGDWGADPERDGYRTDGGSCSADGGSSSDGGDSYGGGDADAEGSSWYGDGCPATSDTTWSDGSAGADAP